MIIINLTQHAASPEQLAAGVVEPNPGHKRIITDALTFDQIPDRDEMVERAAKILALVQEQYPAADAAMLGGAPFFMIVLHQILADNGIKPVYAFSVRESEEQVQADGSVKKVAVFRHRGFVGLDG